MSTALLPTDDVQSNTDYSNLHIQKEKKIQKLTTEQIKCERGDGARQDWHQPG